MKNIFGEKRQRFGFRKLSIGLVSAAVASLFLRHRSQQHRQRVLSLSIIPM